MIPTTALDAVREHLAKTVDRLALPCAHLVRMNLVLRGDLLKRPVATKRLPAQSAPSTPLKTCVSYSSRIPPQSGEYTLTNCTILWDHLNHQKKLDALLEVREQLKGTRICKSR